MKSFNILALLAVLTQGALGQSEKEAGSANVFTAGHVASQYIDRIAHREGDILTVVVVENSSSTQSNSTSLTKTDANKVTNGLPILQGLFSSASTGVSSSNAGAGTTQATGTLTANISVVVKQVLPNGNLVIEGTRTITTNKDTQIFRLTGIVRPDDIATNDTVQSPNVANFNIEVTGKGQIADRQRRGILTRVLDWLF
jgi:flagellar L-ring protein precursor FlgH